MRRRGGYDCISFGECDTLFTALVATLFGVTSKIRLVYSGPYFNILKETDVLTISTHQRHILGTTLLALTINNRRHSGSSRIYGTSLVHQVRCDSFGADEDVLLAEKGDAEEGAILGGPIKKFEPDTEKGDLVYWAKPGGPWRQSDGRVR